jgi:hypothetical protein
MIVVLWSGKVLHMFRNASITVFILLYWKSDSAVVWVRSQASSCGICCRQSGTGIGSFICYTKPRLCISQTQHFLCLLHSLGRHVSTHFETSSGPIFIKYRSCYQLLKCIMGSQTLTIFVLWHCINEDNQFYYIDDVYNLYIFKTSQGIYLYL